jgi:hypothetical protein
MVLAANRREKNDLAREVFRLLAKALKTRKLYSPEHHHAASALDELAGRLETYLTIHATLRVAVARNGLLLEEEAVHAEDPKEPGFAFRIFIAGGRELKLEKGLTRSELDLLLGILAAPDEDDVSERFWETELPHVELLCLNELAEGWDEPPDLSPWSLARIKEMNKHAERIIDGLKKRRLIGEGSLAYRVTDSASEFGRLEKIQLDPEPRQDDSDEDDIVVLSRRAVAALAAEAAAAGSEQLLEAVTALVLRGVLEDPAAIGDQQARWFLDEAPHAALRRQNLRLLATILERFKEALAREGTRVAWALEPVFEHLAREETTARLVQIATGKAIGGPPALVRVLAALGMRAVAIAVSAFLAASSKELEDALLQFLERHAHLDPDALGPLLEKDAPPATARWALFLLSKNGRCEAARHLYERALAHPDKRVRDYASFLVSTQTDRGRFEGFLRALRSRDATERTRAARRLTAAGDVEALEPLCRAVEEPGFPGRAREEQETFFRAIRKVGALAAIPFLSRQTERTSWLHPLGCDVTRRLAQAALDRIKRPGETRRRTVESSAS